MNRFRLLIIILLLVLTNTNTCCFFNAWNIIIAEKQHLEYESLWISNYFVNVSIDLRNGGIIKSYKYGNTEITSTRYFETYMIRDCIFYEITPPVAHLEPWWPGSAFGRVAKLERFEKGIYRSIIEVSYDLYSPDVVLIKKYVFYFDKPWFDIEYVFTNRGQTPVNIDLSSPLYGWNRPVSFGVEISSSFAGTYANDVKIVSTKRALIGGVARFPNLTIADGEVKYVGLLSGVDDYPIPQGIIVIVMNETINETYSVWFEISGSRVRDAPLSNVIRIEMKAFTLPPVSSKKYQFRVYVGPLIYYYLQQLNIAAIRDKYLEATGGKVDLARITVPGFQQPPYTLSISFNVADPGLYPDATLSVYRVLDDGEILIYNGVPDKPVSLKNLSSGLYVVRINPTSGSTRNNEYLFTNLTLNGLEGGEIRLWIMSDTVINVNYELVKLAKLILTFIDETYTEIRRENLKDLVVILIDRYGNMKLYNASEARVILLAPDVYEIVIDKRFGDRSVTDIYFNNLRILYRTDTVDEKPVCRFKLDLRNPGEYDMLVVRYGGAYLAGENPFIIIFLIAIFASAGLILAIIIFFGLRRRRI